jgi:predicted metal-dependent enzyme (double-stranded beta helix superfamily)
MQPHEIERRQEVAHLVGGAMRVIGKRGIVRSTLREILRRLEKLAAKQYLWSTSAYPNPIQSRQSILYSISEEEDRSFALYLHVACPRSTVPPHNHATWACIAAVEGCEDNYLYKPERGTFPNGKSFIKPAGFVAVRPGSGMVVMPRDIRAVGNSGKSFGRHLYFCGQAVETLTSRIQYNLVRHTAKVMPPPAVPTRL